MDNSDNTTYRHPIIPVDSIFYNQQSKMVTRWDINSALELDYKSISTFAALGFMFGDSTYFKQIKVLLPGLEYEINEGKLSIKKPWWEWYYTPKDRSLSNAVEEFSSIFESYISPKVGNEKINLPISGGLDSRSLFVPLQHNKNLNLLSYSFENGFNESSFGQQISQVFNIPMKSFKIPRGYIWNHLETFKHHNGLLTEFTHPRQVAILKKSNNEKNKILLGHWGDVLFDVPSSNIPSEYDNQVILLINSFTNSGGIELAEDLWNVWGLPDTFRNYIFSLFDKQYKKINIDEISAKIRSFKSLYWAPRFTSVNLKIFENMGDLILPYYSHEMCNFICGLPEDLLSKRGIQIQYIKKFCPELAKIPWQKYYPLNLYEYEKYYNLSNIPRRIINKLKRDFSVKVFNQNPLIERNWENQFLGKSNAIKLQNHLLFNEELQKLIPLSITKKYLSKFNNDPHKYSHSVSMLLTLSVFSKHYFSN